MKCKFMTSVFLFCVVSWSICLPRMAAAAPVLDPLYCKEWVAMRGENITGTSYEIAESLYGSQSSEHGYGWVSVQAFYDNPPVAYGAVHVHGVEGGGDFGATALVELRYQFYVEPLEEGLTGPVPLVVSASASVSVNAANANRGHMSYVDIGINGMGWLWQASNYSASTSGVETDSFDEEETFDFHPDTVYTVNMALYSHGAGSGADYYYYSELFMDPTIEIDPGFADADKYRVVFSQGVNEVPLPSSLMLLAPAYLGLAYWRRRQPL